MPHTDLYQIKTIDSKGRDCYTMHDHDKIREVLWIVGEILTNPDTNIVELAVMDWKKYEVLVTWLRIDGRWIKS